MKWNLFQSYYAKITLISLLSISVLVFFSALSALNIMHSMKNESKNREYQEGLQELEKSYNDIYQNYYKVFISLVANVNEADISAFCRGKEVGYSGYEVQQRFERILASACSQDIRIRGIYFRNLRDESRYLYSKADQGMKKVYFKFENEQTQEKYRRLIVGGRKINMSLKEDEKDVFGIQSGIISSGKNCSYQVTVLYDLSCFDTILSRYDIDPGVRFLITMADGTIIYDNEQGYLTNKASRFEEIEKLTGEGDTFIDERCFYIKGMRSLRKGNCLAFYLVPQTNITRFRLDKEETLVVLMAVIIHLVMITVMVLVNRVVSRKFQGLERAMLQVGKTNMSYRIPVGRRKDEFSQIAVRFNQMCDELEEMIDKNYISQILQRNAEYKALQTSVNPHFLYNSLEAIREKLDVSGQNDEAEMVLLLSRIFEYQIRGDSIVTIYRELNALQNYIDFTSIRYQYSFDYSIDFEDKIMDYIVPKQIFQPIMENYFAHGFRGDEQDHISISGYLDTEDGMIHICFCDNGKGLTREQAERLMTALDEREDTFHIGLRNVHNRLKIIFGKESRVEIFSNAPDTGIKVSLIFRPMLNLEEDQNQPLGSHLAL